MWFVREERKNRDGEWVTWTNKYKGPFEKREDTYVPVGLAESFNDPYTRYIAWEEE